MVKKKEIEKMREDFILQKYEGLKISLDRYSKAIARYCFTDFSTTGELFEEMWKKEMFSTIEVINKSGLSKRIKKRLRSETFMFSTCPKYRGGEHEYIKSQIGFAKLKLDGLGWDKKLEIVKDCLSQKALWSKEMSINYKVRKEIEELKKKKPVKKKVKK